MKTFLDHLNQADAAEFSQTPGIGLPLAERIVAARPFERVEDSLAVNGLGEKLLQRLRDRFNEMEIDPMSEETGLVPPPPPAPEPVSRPGPNRPRLSTRLPGLSRAQAQNQNRTFSSDWDAPLSDF
jgi:hypothetical protein